MNEKENEVGNGFATFNSWDDQSGNSGNKSLIKSFPGQVPTSETVEQPFAPQPLPTYQVQEEQPSVPFVAPEIDFTTVMPTFDEPVAKPIGASAPVFAPFGSREDVDRESNRIVNEAKPIEGFSIAAPVNDMAIPVFDMPQSQIINEPNPQQAILDRANSIENHDPVDIVSEPILAEERPQVVINTMTPEELTRNFGAVIEEDKLKDVIRKPGDTMVMAALPTNGQLVEPYQEASDNTFSSIFSNVPTAENFVDTKPKEEVIVSDVGVPTKEQRVELTTPDHPMSYHKQKKTIIPKGWGLGIFVFGLLMVFVLKMDTISQIVNEVLYNLTH